MKSTISSQGQITVPAAIRAALGLRAGTAVVFEARPGGAFLRKSTEGRHPVDRLFGSLPLAGPVDPLMDAMRGPRAAAKGPRAARKRKAKARR